MRRTIGALTGIAVAMLVARTADARTGRNSFLERPANDQYGLLSQVRWDPRVADRYVRHFGMKKKDVIEYLRGLELSTIKRNDLYVVYYSPDSGALLSVVQKLPKGTPIWVDAAGKPIMKKSCGNPLTRGPKRLETTDITQTEKFVPAVSWKSVNRDVSAQVVDDIETTAVIQPTIPNVSSVLATTDSPIDYMTEKPSPFSSPLSDGQPVNMTDIPTPSVGALDFLLPFLTFLPAFMIDVPWGGTGSNPPPPVPELDTWIAFAVGIAGLWTYRQAASRRR